MYFLAGDKVSHVPFKYEVFRVRCLLSTDCLYGGSWQRPDQGASEGEREREESKENRNGGADLEFTVCTRVMMVGICVSWWRVGDRAVARERKPYVCQCLR